MSSCRSHSFVIAGRKPGKIWKIKVHLDIDSYNGASSFGALGRSHCSIVEWCWMLIDAETGWHWWCWKRSLHWNILWMWCCTPKKLWNSLWFQSLFVSPFTSTGTHLCFLYLNLASLKWGLQFHFARSGMAFGPWAWAFCLRFVEMKRGRFQGQKVQKILHRNRKTSPEFSEPSDCHLQAIQGDSNNLQ